MKQLNKAKELLLKYGILNDKLACDIAIMVVEAKRESIKNALNDMEDRNDDSARYETFNEDNL